MRVALIGAGLQGTAIAYDLARQERVEEIIVADLDLARAERVAESDPERRTEARRLDAGAAPEAAALAAEVDVLVSATYYGFNPGLARAAIAGGAHFCDLGGNNEVVDRELALDAEARRAGVTIIPDCGLAPGMANVMAALAVARHPSPEALHIRVGGLPIKPKPPLDYKLVFAPEGLINEYVEPARLLREGREVEVESLTEIERLSFPGFGPLEAFHTSGGSSTLPRTFSGRLRTLDYKTIRYPGHCERMRLLRDLGLMDSKPVRSWMSGVAVAPREFLEALLADRLVDDDEDVVLVRVESGGPHDGGWLTHLFELIDRSDPATGHTAMMRTTGYPAAIVAGMLGRGEIRETGAVPQELAVPGEAFLEALRSRGFAITERQEVLRSSPGTDSGSKG
jgi:lysine 6-dehydrogenase